MEWFNAFEAPLDADMRQLHLNLIRDGVAHRIVEEGGKQVLLLVYPHDKALLEQRVAEWRDGSLPFLTESGEETMFRRVLHWLSGVPIVFITAVLSVVGAAIVWFDLPYLIALLVFQSVEFTGGNISPKAVSGALADGQFWKLWTPMFLHFGIFHLLFNLLWLFEFGARVERYQSGTRLLIVIIVSGLISNGCQFWADPVIIFGGLSGVVYGLFGYCALHSRLYRSPFLAPRPGVITFLIAWLLIGMSGIISMLGIANIANAAHFGGLVTGLLLAFLPKQEKV